MERASIPVVDESDAGAVAVHRLSDKLGTTDLAINHYRLAPGEALPAGLHAHGDQEEVFVVLEGEAGFEMLLPGDEATDDVAKFEARETTVAQGEVIRFAPGDYQSGWNVANEETSILALGAPRESDNVRLPIGCPNCDTAPIRLALGGGEFTFECGACGVSSVPAPCPECDGENLEVALRDDLPMVECQDCGAHYETPPSQG